jgi:protein-tyrosine phosphatase
MVRAPMSKPNVLATGIGAAALAASALALRVSGAPRVALAWIALACALVAAAYLRNRPGVLGKRDGKISWWRSLPVLPYLLAYRCACALRRLLRRRPAWNEVAPGLYVGGRVAASGLPPGLELLVDLTSEWSAPRELRRLPGYRSLPVLDGCAPRDEEGFLLLLEEIAAAEGAVYIHCESGKGRAPTAAVLALVARGVAEGPHAALEQVAKGRPLMHLTSVDLAFISHLAPHLAARFALD